MPTGVYHRTEEYCNKMSLIMQGKPKIHSLGCVCVICIGKRGELKGKNHPVYGKHWKGVVRTGEANNFFGKKHSVETKKHWSEIRKGQQLGEEHPNWNGGSSFYPYPVKFNFELKEFIRERDGRICQAPGCNKTEQQNGRKLDVHHINYIKEDISLYNLISLCTICHLKTNFNREYWQPIFEEKNCAWLGT